MTLPQAMLLILGSVLALATCARGLIHLPNQARPGPFSEMDVSHVDRWPANAKGRWLCSFRAPQQGLTASSLTVEENRLGQALRGAWLQIATCAPGEAVK